MKKLHFILFSLFLHICHHTNGQDYINTGINRLDSLRQAVKNCDSDTAKINVLNQFAQQCIDLNYLATGDSALREALTQADQTNYTKFKGDSYNKIGLIHMTRNEMDSARTYFIKALSEDERSKNRSGYIRHLGNIGLTYSVELNHSQALNCHRSALHMAELFKERRVLPFCYNNIGIVCLARFQMKDAFHYLYKSLAENADNKDIKSKYISLKCISEVYQSMGDYSEALTYANMALDIAKSIGNKYKVEICYTTIASIYNSLGNRSTAIDYYFQALKIAEETGNKKDIAALIGDIGGRYYDLGEKEKGFEYLKKGYAKMIESGNKAGIALTTGWLGLFYFEQGDLDKATHYYEQSIALMNEIGTSDDSHFWINNLAQIYLVRAQRAVTNDSAHYYYNKSLNYLTQALDLAYRLNKKNDISHSYLLIGIVYENQRQFKKAEEYYQKCIQLSSITGEINYRQDAHKRLSDIYGIQRNYQLQVQHYRKFILLKDSAINLTGAEKKVRSEVNYEYEQKQVIEKQKQKERNNLILADKKQQQTLLWSVISVALFILFIAALTYKTYLTKKKINQELENKNQKIRKANKIIKEKNHEIRDSINYALHIQQAILPDKNQITHFLPQNFILFQPKDIVSGDFYFFTTAHNKIYLAAADCTGHGVPGGFMSMIGTEKLNMAVKQSSNTGKILSLLNEGIKSSLHQSEHEFTNRDGMDIALCAIDVKQRSIEFSGANRPLWIVRNDSDVLEEITGTKASIGGITENNKQFETHSIQLKHGDTFYLFSDGYADQFGANDKKMNTRRLKSLLAEIKNFELLDQQDLLKKFLDEWKGDAIQTDDILVIGVRL
ncbi:MAG TPA: tetratricopeptide repeat protein [Bacteroidia bacterium]|jgi:serine phosphatase RsbU (regulator of sigma subunit)/Tfp pilus assembly protein PilF|nr:tetratricopeptide repeat protein [Bacteroidia bacterium]